MPSIESMRPTSADRIAQLTAELAEAQKQFEEYEANTLKGYQREIDNAREHVVEAVGKLRAERAAHERTKVELAAVRQYLDENPSSLGGQLERTKAARRRWKACAKKWRSIVKQVDAECAAAYESELAAKRDARAARADAAALCEAIRHALDTLHSPRVRPAGHEGCEESGKHYEDCARCAVEASIAHGEAALDGTAGRAIAERVTLLEAREKLNDLRRRCAVALFDEGHIEAVHEDGCPEDDTCDCPLMPLVHAVLNVDQNVDVAAAEAALAALDAKGGAQ